MSQFDKPVFSNKKFGDILEDIYNNSRSKAVDLEAMVRELRILIKTPQDAILIVPLIADYFGKGISNDDLLVKMASIIQRAITRDDALNPTSTELIFSEADWAQLQEITDIQELELPQIPEKIKNATKNLDNQ